MPRRGSPPSWTSVHPSGRGREPWPSMDSVAFITTPMLGPTRYGWPWPAAMIRPCWRRCGSPVTGLDSAGALRFRAAIKTVAESNEIDLDDFEIHHAEGADDRRRRRGRSSVWGGGAHERAALHARTDEGRPRPRQRAADRPGHLPGRLDGNPSRSPPVPARRYGHLRAAERRRADRYPPQRGRRRENSVGTLQGSR